MGKLFRLLWTLLAVFSVGTLISLGIVFGYLASSGRLNEERMKRIVELARGNDPPPAPVAETAKEPEKKPTQEEIAARHSLEMRNIELREQALAAGVSQLKFERALLARERTNFDYEKDAFYRTLGQNVDETVAAGRANERQIWEKLKPKQAKEQIMLMLQADEMNEVVRLMGSLPARVREKIAAEFKAPDEQQKLSDILRLMRAGEPDASQLDEARKRFTPSSRTNDTPTPSASR